MSLLYILMSATLLTVALYFFRTEVNKMIKQMIKQYLKSQIDDIYFAQIAVEIAKEKLAAFDVDAFAKEFVAGLGSDLNVTIEAVVNAIMAELSAIE